MPFRLIALFSVLACSALAQTATPPTFVQPAPPGSPDVPKTGSLEVSRSGNEVLLTWVLPEGDVRLIELYRNTQKEPSGRGRVSALGGSTVTYLDVVADADVTYWYWLKITRPDGQIFNIGPVATPSATVWTP